MCRIGSRARATSGHAAAPPMRVMNLRRLMGVTQGQLITVGIAGLRWIRGRASQQKAVPLFEMGHKPRRRSGPGVGLCPQCLQSRRNFVHRSERRQVPIPDLSRCSNVREQSCGYSMTSSARAESVGGTSRPNSFAVFRLITNSNLVGCTTGRSAGFSPLRIRAV